MIATTTKRVRSESSPADSARPSPAFRFHCLWLWRSPGRYLGLVAAFLALTFPKLLLGWHTLFYRDFGVLGYPFIHLHRAMFWNGELPLWNPLSNSGAPFMAQWGTLTLYPFSLIYLLLPLPWSVNLVCFGHLAWGALGMYHLGRHWTANRLAGAAAGIFFVFNGITLSCLLWPNYAVALGWMPWVILLTERAVRQGGRPLLWAALAATCQLLAGVPELVLMTWLVIACFAVRDLCVKQVEWKPLACRLGWVVGLAAGLAAAQLLPFFDLLASSHRDATFATSKWALPTWGWANLLVPLFHNFQTPQGTFFQFGQTFLASCYLGLPVTVLALWALWRVRQPTVWILGGLFLFSLIMSLGDAGGLYAWIRKVFPMFGVGRYPVKFMILAVFTVPVLAAYGLASLQRSRLEGLPKSLVAVLAATGVAILGILWVAKTYPFTYDQWDVTFRNTMIRLLVLGGGFALIWMALRNATPKRNGLCWAVLFVLVVADARLHSPNQIPTLPSDAMSAGFWQEYRTNPPPAIGEGRVLITPVMEARLLRSTIEDHQQDFVGKRMALWSNLNLLDGIPKVNGSSTLQIREQKEVQDIIYKSDPTNALPESLLNFLSVNWVSSSNSLIEWDPRAGALPWVTGGQQPVFMDREQALAHLASPDFKPADEVLLSTPTQEFVSDVQAAPCRIGRVTATANRVQFDVEAGAKAMVVVAQTHHLNWEATVDGRRVALFKANHAFQALVVPAGKHQVELRYVDAWFHSGLGITLAAAAASLLLWSRTRRSIHSGGPA